MTTVRLLTWNIWGKNADWQAREDALLATLADVHSDIVTVQEAWTDATGSTQTARLAVVSGHRNGTCASDHAGVATSLILGADDELPL